MSDSLRTRVKSMVSYSKVRILIVGFLVSMFYLQLVQNVESEENDIKSSTPNFTFANLTKVTNMGFRDEIAGDQKGGWDDGGKNDLRTFPVGEQNFCNIPFNIIDPTKNNGKSCIVLKGKPGQYFPEEVILNVNKKAKTVYFLHTCTWSWTEGEAIAEYDIIYEDAEIETIFVRYGVEISGWYDPQDTSKSLVAWEGSNPIYNFIGIYIFPWRNPYPEKIIKAIKFKSLNTSAIPILIATTFSDSPVTLKKGGESIVRTDTTGWIKFTFPDNAPDFTPIDVSFLLEPPAGKRGFVKTNNGHYYFEDGTRIKFWGGVLIGQACFPTHEQAERTAARLARFGFNMVRLSAMDLPLSWKCGLFDDERNHKSNSTQYLSPEYLDKLDYLVYQLKKKGIYIQFDLFSMREFEKGDGITDDTCNNATEFNQRLIELQKKYAHDLFMHFNPYTKSKYADEPTIALIDIVNERSLFWIGSHSCYILSKGYMDELTSKWNEWLTKKYTNRQNLANSWTDETKQCALRSEEDPLKGTVFFPSSICGMTTWQRDYTGRLSPARVNDASLFISEIQSQYYEEMCSYLRSIGVKTLITGTNLHHGGPADLKSNAKLDFVDMHSYWTPPVGPHQVSVKNPINVSTVPMVKANPFECGDIRCNQSNAISYIASAKVNGKPQATTESGTCYPAEYRAEGPLLMAAYACLQDWDALIRHVYNHSGEIQDSMHMHFATINVDPAVIGLWPTAALMFLRSDIQKATTLVQIGHSNVDTFYSQNNQYGLQYGTPFGFLPFISRVENVFFDDVYTGEADVVISSGRSSSGSYHNAKHAIVFSENPWADLYNKKQNPYPAIARNDDKWLYKLFLEKSNSWNIKGIDSALADSAVFISDTKELVWDYGKGVLRINAPRTQGATGYLEQEELSLSDLNISSKTNFCSIILTSLDGAIIRESKRLLLTAVGRAENTGQEWLGNKKDKLVNWGQAPILIEPIEASLTLASNIAEKGPITVYALNSKGERTKEVEIKKVSGGIKFSIGKIYETIYYEIVRP